MLINNFKTTLVDWLNEEGVDEWYLDSFKQKMVKELNPEQAYSFIDDALEVLIDQEDSSDLIDVLEVIIVLSNLSKTTELPKKLLKYKCKLKVLFSDKGDYVKSRLQNFFKLYRLT